jgi:hypothetical protein
MGAAGNCGMGVLAHVAALQEDAFDLAECMQ